jgi:hypothetical protein
MVNEPIRRRFKISLRTLMILILVLGTGLGWHVNKAREQLAAVAAVQRNGGWVHYDYEFVNGKLTAGRQPWAPRWLRAVIGDAFFREISQVSLVYDDATGTRFDNQNLEPCDDLLARLARQTRLKELLLQKTQATDLGLKQIGKMTSLEKLFIWDGASVTDAGVAHLAKLKNLTHIHISRSNLSDRSLALLSNLPRMESLSLQQNHFSDRELMGRERLKRLAIGLGDCRITDAGLVHLNGFQNLELLDLQNSQVTARGVEQLSGLKKLKALWLSATAVTDAEKTRLRQALPNAAIQ